MIYCRLRGLGMDLVWTYNGSLGTGFRGLRGRGLWILLYLTKVSIAFRIKTKIFKKYIN